MLEGFKNWAAQPFRADMPLQNWFAFIGLILVAIVLWNIILRHIQEA
jgi:hypothetical protein